MPTKLKVSDIEVSYGDGPVINGVSFEVGKGDFVAVVGPNGSGKTTLLRALSHALRPVRGAVYLDEREIVGLSGRALAREMAVVPQESSVAFEFTALEIVLMGRSPHLGRFAIEGSHDLDIATEAMEQTRTLHVADRPLNTLSGGERQRVIIARALAQQAEVILLDEPTSHLDINFQVEILELVRRLTKEKGITVLAVLHDLNLSAQYCDWMMLLRDGRIHAAGSPEETLTADNVREVYGAEVWVRRHPATGRPYVISGVSSSLLGTEAARKFESGLRVHVICGGGTGAPVFAKLLRRGYRVTAGVLNQGDADQDVAESLGVETVTEPPFSPISEESLRRNLKLIEGSDCVVLTDAPLGKGNILNLQAALQAAKSGKPVIVMDGQDLTGRDFTGGEATGILEEIVAGGAAIADGLNAVAAELERMTDVSRE